MQKNTQTNEQIHEILFEKDDVTWQSIIYELVKSEKIDPWDIDINKLTQKYIEVVKQLKEFDFSISGKILLASAILLRIKSNKLVGEDLDEFDRIIAGQQDEDFFEDDFNEALTNREEGPQTLIPRLPQPRKRKVSIYDLMGALEKALEVKQRRVVRDIPSFDIELPKKKSNISLTMQSLYLKIRKFFVTGNKELTFSKLIPSETKEDKVLTLIPLLHLSNKNQVNLTQKEHFGEILINLKTNQDINKELAEVNTNS
ncbi:hypothetical protein CEE44_04860 [Candidatus Woesearchaeota archaeon B3_Woes]|nr:MAG: hypothetical protein CEE44_04860 [Candidatus Woesearchaeota archaeon B3_Woes]